MFVFTDVNFLVRNGAHRVTKIAHILVLIQVVIEFVATHVFSAG